MDARRPRTLHHLIRSDTGAGLILAAAAVAGLLAANSPARGLYASLLRLPVSVQAGEFLIAKPLVLWINDGLMALFFLAVGLEIKRELLEGQLSSVRKALLPAVAALGGMAVPAAIFLLFNFGTETARGWAIPTATDIAFAVALAAALPRQVPRSLRAFLLALAIIDDIGAIAIIAAFYTAGLSATALAFACAWTLLLLLLHRLGVNRVSPYVVLGVLLWATVLKSGVHATLAGVIVALAIPLRTGTEPHREIAHRVQKSLQPWVSFAILPLFAFANAGVSLEDITLDALLAPLPAGIAAGLLFGKFLGVTGASALAVRLRLGVLPTGTHTRQFAGMAMLTGIGFTMSLFLGNLAFPEGEHDAAIRAAVLLGSLLSAAGGFLWLRFLTPRRAGSS
jgi:NhaA family Na+:H+ antiporter